MVDPLVMRHATAIVLDNAIRHSAGGRIEVIAAADEDRLTVRIESSGSLDRNAGATHGSGVGLGLCQALVGRAGGSVELTETVSTVRVTFTLPIHTATRDAIA
jgi:signal transduction histidine kinase